MKLSIITVCLNADRIEKTCQSIVSQTFKDFEWIVIDGGSNKETLDILQKYRTQMAYFVSEKDSGIYNAMNKGILKAKGEYLLFLNGGDYLYADEVLEKIFAQNITADLASGILAIRNTESNQENIGYPPKKVTHRFLLERECGLFHPSTLIKKTLFEKYGLYQEKYRIVSDTEKWIVFLKGDCSYQYVNEIITIFYTDGISSKNIDTTRKETEEMLSEHYCVADIKRFALKNEFNEVGIKKCKIKLFGISVLKIISTFETTTILLFNKIPLLKIRNYR